MGGLEGFGGQGETGFDVLAVGRDVRRRMTQSSIPVGRCVWGAMIIRVVIVVLLFGGLGVWAGEVTKPKMIPFKTALDAKGSSVELRLHVFEPSGDVPKGGRSAIVLFFGGGWVGGAPVQFYPQCEYFAERGMVAISAEYRTRSAHGTSPVECVKDGKSAIRFVRKNAGTMGIDPDRIVAGGGSAGGHVAAATATVKGFEESEEEGGVSARPDALVLFNPVYDNSPEGYGNDRVHAFWRSFSPLHNLSERMPPAIVFLGTKDNLIPVATGERFRDEMRRLGVRSELFLYEGQGHGFFNSRNKEYFEKTTREADRFLTELGFLRGR